MEHLNATLTAHMRRSLPPKTAREKLFADLGTGATDRLSGRPQVEDADALIAVRGTVLPVRRGFPVVALLSQAQKPAPAPMPEETDIEA